MITSKREEIISAALHDALRKRFAADRKEFDSHGRWHIGVTKRAQYVCVTIRIEAQWSHEAHVVARTTNLPLHQDDVFSLQVVDL